MSYIEESTYSFIKSNHNLMEPVCAGPYSLVYERSGVHSIFNASYEMHIPLYGEHSGFLTWTVPQYSTSVL